MKYPFSLIGEHCLVKWTRLYGNSSNICPKARYATHVGCYEGADLLPRRPPFSEKLWPTVARTRLGCCASSAKVHMRRWFRAEAARTSHALMPIARPFCNRGWITVVADWRQIFSFFEICHFSLFFLYFSFGGLLNLFNKWNYFTEIGPSRFSLSLSLKIFLLFETVLDISRPEAILSLSLFLRLSEGLFRLEVLLSN